MAHKTMLDLRDRQARFLERRSATFHRKSEKSTPLRARKRRARFMMVTIIFFSIASIIFAVTSLSHAKRFVINSIQVQGVHDISAQSVIDYVTKRIDDSTWHYISQKNIFAIDERTIEEGLVQDMPRIRSVKISRPSKFSQALVVSIDERNSAALWCQNSGSCYLMDESGYIFDQASAITVTSYSFDGGVATSTPIIGQTFAGGHMQEILTLLERLRKSGFTAGGVSVDSSADYRAHLIKGYDLKISFGVDPNKLVRDLDLVLTSDALKGQESNLAYVDLRFGNRVYFKLKGEVDAKISAE